MLDWIDNDTPGPWRRALEPIGLAVVTFVSTLAVADICYPALRSVYHGDGAYLSWLDIYWLLEPGAMTPWWIALAVALVVGLVVASGWSRRRFVRVAGALLSLASLCAVVLLIVQRPEVHQLTAGGRTQVTRPTLPWPALLGLVAGGLGGLWLALGQGLSVRQSGLRRGGVLLGTMAAAVLLGAVSIGDYLDEHQPQRFRPFQGQLVAVRWLPPNTRAAAGSETITHDKRTYVVLSQPKRFWFTDKDVRRVRLRHLRDYRGEQHGVSIRFRDGLHRRIAARTRYLSRHGLHDALYVDGKLLLVAQVNAVIVDGILVITDGPRDSAPVSGRLHRALTR